MIEAVHGLHDRVLAETRIFGRVVGHTGAFALLPDDLRLAFVLERDAGLGREDILGCEERAALEIDIDVARAAIAMRAAIEAPSHDLGREKPWRGIADGHAGDALERYFEIEVLSMRPHGRGIRELVDLGVEEFLGLRLGPGEADEVEVDGILRLAAFLLDEHRNHPAARARPRDRFAGEQRPALLGLFAHAGPGLLDRHILALIA